MGRKLINPSDINVSDIVNRAFLARGKMDVPAALYMVVERLADAINEILFDIYDEMDQCTKKPMDEKLISLDELNKKINKV